MKNGNPSEGRFIAKVERLRRAHRAEEQAKKELAVQRQEPHTGATVTGPQQYAGTQTFGPRRVYVPPKRKLTIERRRLFDTDEGTVDLVVTWS